MKRQLLSIIMLIVAGLVVVACGGRAEQSVVSDQMGAEVMSEAYSGAAPAAMPMAVAEVDLTANDSSAQLPPGQERLIIRTADMSIVATDTEQALAQIAAMADSSGGWVVESNVYQSTDTAKSGYVRIRVPAEGFQSVLDAIAGLAVEVNSLSTSGQDVTEEFVDLSARLGNMEATAARLRQFLADAENVEEALAVNVELSRVEGDIESLQGRIQFLQQSAAFSSITVNVTPDVLAQPIRVGGWQPSGVAKEAIEALVSMLQVLANAVIWFVLFALPILLVVAIPFILLIWIIKRLRRRERAAEASASSQE